MLHKKQSFEQIQRTVKWNTDRGNTTDTLNLQLEVDMLQEELDEFKEAIAANDKVAMFDALLDLDFVRIGTLSKLGINPTMQVDGYEAVLVANESKSSKKNSAGKITKPVDFVGPESKLKQILNKSNL